MVNSKWNSEWETPVLKMIGPIHYSPFPDLPITKLASQLKRSSAVFKKPGIRFILVMFSLLMIASVVAAQAQQTKPAKQAKQNQTPDEKSRKLKAEPDSAYKRWLEEDVAPIITPPERAAYQKLKTNAEREEFIKLFWGQRDPTPDTEENEYRDQY